MKSTVAILLAVLCAGCSLFNLDVGKGEELDANSHFRGFIIEPCVEVGTLNQGCQFMLAVEGDRLTREFFVPWGTDLYNEVRLVPRYGKVKVEGVDRGDGVFVLRSIRSLS